MESLLFLLTEVRKIWGGFFGGSLNSLEYTHSQSQEIQFFATEVTSVKNANEESLLLAFRQKNSTRRKQEETLSPNIQLPCKFWESSVDFIKDKLVNFLSS